MSARAGSSGGYPAKMEPRNGHSAKNLRTALVLATIALVFFLGFLMRRYFLE